MMAWRAKVGQALQLEPCEDPLHSVAARDAVDKKAGVYQAVNKPFGALEEIFCGLILVVDGKNKFVDVISWWNSWWNFC